MTPWPLIVNVASPPVVLFNATWVTPSAANPTERPKTIPKISTPELVRLGPDPSNTTSTGASAAPVAHSDPSWHQTSPEFFAVAWLGVAAVLIRAEPDSVPVQPLTQG